MPNPRAGQRRECKGIASLTRHIAHRFEQTYVHVDKDDDEVSAYIFKHPLPSNLKCIMCGKLFTVSAASLLLWAIDS